MRAGKQRDLALITGKLWRSRMKTLNEIELEAVAGGAPLIALPYGVVIAAAQIAEEALAAE
jgi:hypothetical protein